MPPLHMNVCNVDDRSPLVEWSRNVAVRIASIEIVPQSRQPLGEVGVGQLSSRQHCLTHRHTVRPAPELPETSSIVSKVKRVMEPACSHAARAKG